MPVRAARRLPRLTLALAITHLLPVAAWAAFKPVRVLAPEWLGLHCAASGVCIDDVGRLAEAEKLRSDALDFVSHRVGAIAQAPRTIFCTTLACSQAFGFTSNAAYNVGTFGLVISHRGWQPHFVRHELIHHLQNERLGTWNAWLFKPSWLIEGMAYSLSEDPRQPLPPPLQGWRASFQQWRASVQGQDLWQAASDVQRER